MKISEKRRTELYGAIHDRIMDLRIKMNYLGLSDEGDRAVAATVKPIFRDVLEVLGVEDAT